MNHACALSEGLLCNAQGCQYSGFVAIFSKFLDPSRDCISKKRVGTSLVSFLRLLETGSGLKALQSCSPAAGGMEMLVFISKINHCTKRGQSSNPSPGCVKKSIR